MEVDTARDSCLGYPGVTEGFPFGPGVLVFKVAGKMFALLGLDNEPPTMNLKCDPERALALRAEYRGVVPGYHMNKKLWNTVTLRGDVPDALILDLIQHSYDLVVANLPKKTQRALAGESS